MFVGRQMQPQEKKPYGAAGERYSGIKEAYYACRMCDVLFPVYPDVQFGRDFW